MNPDPDLERLEERVREAFPACQHPPIIIPQAPFFPEISQDCWTRFLDSAPKHQHPVILSGGVDVFTDTLGRYCEPSTGWPPFALTGTLSEIIQTLESRLSALDRQTPET